MKLIVLAALVAAGVAASAQPTSQPSSPLDEPVELRMTPEQRAQCQAEGGCQLFTRAYIESLVEQAQKRACRNPAKEA